MLLPPSPSLCDRVLPSTSNWTDTGGRPRTYRPRSRVATPAGDESAGSRWEVRVSAREVRPVVIARRHPRAAATASTRSRRHHRLVARSAHGAFLAAQQWQLVASAAITRHLSVLSCFRLGIARGSSPAAPRPRLKRPRGPRCRCCIRAAVRPPRASSTRWRSNSRAATGASRSSTRRFRVRPSWRATGCRTGARCRGDVGTC